MKRLFLILAALLLACPAWGTQTVYRHVQPATLAYDTLVAGVNPAWWTLNENVKAIYFGSGITISGFTGQISYPSGGPYFWSNPNSDLRKWIGFYGSWTETTHTLKAQITAAGAGETYGSNLIVNPGVDQITLTYGTRVGNFAVNDVVTDAISSATGTISADNGSVMTLTGVAGAFGNGNAISGAPSLATAVTTSYTMTGLAGNADTGLASIAGGQSGNCLQITRGSDGYPRAVTTASITLNTSMLYKMSAYFKQGTKSGNNTLVLNKQQAGSDPNGIVVSGTHGAAWTQYSAYGNPIQATSCFWVGGALNTAAGLTVLFDELYFAEVLTASVLGVNFGTPTNGGIVPNTATWTLTVSRN